MDDSSLREASTPGSAGVLRARQAAGFDELASSITRGKCIAFIGAGFSQPAVPGWADLLQDLTREVPDPRARKELQAWLSEQPLGARDFEGIGQTIETELGGSFKAALRKCLDGPTAPIADRLRFLRGIPFHYVLTTNFDSLLGPGCVPSTETYAQAIMAPNRPWSHDDFWSDGGDGAQCALWSGRLLRLHGDLLDRGPEEALVFTTRGYRQLLHGDPAYRGFLRTMFATHNVLYLGFSFTDAYISDLRSEILAMIGLQGDARRGMDFALLPDVSSATAKHMREHNGLQVLGFDSKNKTDFRGFDDWLEAVWRATNPAGMLRDRIRGSRILWFDPKPHNNELGFRTLTEKSSAQGALVENVKTFEETLARLERENHRLDGGYDLVITHWGYRPNKTASGQRLLNALRERNLKVPVIIFSSARDRATRRRLAHRLGALAYTTRWGELFGVIDRLFHDAS